MRRRVRVLVCMALVGCGSSGGSSGGHGDAAPPDAAPPDDAGAPEDAAAASTIDAASRSRSEIADDVEAFVAAYVIAICDRVERCCAAAGQPRRASDCVDSWGAAVTYAREDAMAGRVDVDPVAAATCLAWFERGPETCVERVSPACGEAALGRVAQGGLCGWSAACDAGGGQAVCTGHNAVGEGHCEISPPAGAGEACDDSPNAEPNAPVCRRADGLACDAEQHLCVPLAAEGESCATRPCGDALDCDFETAKCVRPAAVGEPCDDRPCASGATCRSGRCAALNPEGSPCDPGDPFSCGDDNFCTAEGTCGAAVGTDLWYECAEAIP